MTTVNNNKRLLHRKEWQMMTPAPTASAAGAFIIKDNTGSRRTALYVASSTAQYYYAVDEDAYLQVPSMALGGTFGAGACGAWTPWSDTLTATGGTTSTLTTTALINSAPTGRKIRFLTGSQAGKEVTVTATSVIAGGTKTLTFEPTLSGAIANTDTFVIDVGRYWVFNAGTLSASSFKRLNVITGTVTALSVTGLPATWGTDGRLVSTPSYVGAFATGTATSGTSTTIVNSAKNWTVNQWCNYQVRITAGTGIGQVRSITTNTATTLTVPTWTVTPDSTSVYSIEGNDDYLYLLGNNAVTMYRYSISGNSWTTLSPTTARDAAPGTGMGANWCGVSGNTVWADETNILDGRYIFSFRGGATSTLHRYDIAGGTAGAGAWATITYNNAAETFTTGSSYDMEGNKIYIRKDNSHRYFYYNVDGNDIYPFSTLLYQDSTAVLGDKIFTVKYTDGSTNINWLYSLRNTGTELHRVMIF